MIIPLSPRLCSHSTRNCFVLCCTRCTILFVRNGNVHIVPPDFGAGLAHKPRKTAFDDLSDCISSANQTVFQLDCLRRLQTLGQPLSYLGPLSLVFSQLKKSQESRIQVESKSQYFNLLSIHSSHWKLPRTHLHKSNQHMLAFSRHRS